MEEWISLKDGTPRHMQIIKVYVENPFFGSFERDDDAVYLHFKGYDEGSFYDANEQIYLDYITKWKPLESESKTPSLHSDDESK